jgi:hypothetical protein
LYLIYKVLYCQGLFPDGIGARLPRRTRTKPREWWKLSNAQLDDEVDDDNEDAEMGYEIALSTVSNDEPLSYAEALRCTDAEQWKHAALEELNAHSTLFPMLNHCPMLKPCDVLMQSSGNMQP